VKKGCIIISVAFNAFGARKVRGFNAGSNPFVIRIQGAGKKTT
jgi:hypothetical protein